MDTSYAHGQVLVIPFAVTLAAFKSRTKPSLDNETTILIIKPHFRADKPFFKFAGGMLQSAQEPFAIAALRELYEETGVVGQADQLVEILSRPKTRHAPGTGTFELKLYLAFGCDFTHAHSRTGQVGDEGEESLEVRFGGIAAKKHWPIPSQPHRTARIFPTYLRLLDEAIRNLTAAN